MHHARVSLPSVRKTFAFNDPLESSFAGVAAACVRAGFMPVTAGWPVLDPSEYFAHRADSFSAEELDAAQAALLEDGVFTSPDWMAVYLDREFGGLRFTSDSLTRAAVKYGWAVAFAAELAARVEGEFEITFAGTSQSTTPIEHLFIAFELRRRGVSPAALALRWPGRFEAAVDFEDDVAEFEQAVVAHSAVARLAGDYRLGFSHAEEKFNVLPMIGRECGERLHLKISGLRWMAALRVIARVEPALFRDILRSAQEHFAFDKVGADISTNEEDVRFLPEVSDEELERTFLEHVRGRQLLHVTAGSILREPRLADPLRAALAAHSALHGELLGISFARHLAALGAEGVQSFARGSRV